MAGDGHPSCRDLKVVSEGRGAGGARARVSGHLQRGCPTCARVLHELVETSYPADLTESGLARMSSWVAAAEASSAEVEELLGELGRHPTGRQLMLVQSVDRFRTLGMVKALCKRSRDLLSNDPRRACGIARVAVALTEKLEKEDYPSELVSDFAARAWVRVGHAERRASNLVASEIAFRRAEAMLSAGTGDELEWAELVYSKAGLRMNQGSGHEAIELMQLAAGVYQRLENWHEVGRILLDEAIVWAENEGQYDEACWRLLATMSLIDSEKEPRLLLAAVHNLATYLIELELLGAALEIVRAARPLYELAAGRSERLRRTWVEARILAKLGWTREAASKFERARSGFLELGAPKEATLLALEEALVVGGPRRRSILRFVVESMLPILKANGLELEALGALRLVSAEVEEQVQTGVVRQAILALRRARLSPSE